MDAIGPKVDAFYPGDQVYAKASFAHGGYAEYTIVNDSQAALKTLSIGFIEAADVPYRGLTAWQMLFDVAGLKSDQKVLIHGAAGGVQVSPFNSQNGRELMPSLLRPVTTVSS